ncbi:MAG: transposase [Candidatus Aureabacteria bacterium]|nr:transposase [Candidatus Auribacterota bacterium]
MARPYRFEFEGAFYHITARGNERKKIYRNARDYEKFLEIITGAKGKYGFLLHSYVLMGNHYHLLIETPLPNLTQIMHLINGWYTTYFNIKHQRSGHFFQGRYKSIILEAESHLLGLSRYIHLNPVRAGMVNDPLEYRWSSLNDFIKNKKRQLTDTEMLIKMFQTKKEKGTKNYLEFVYQGKGVNEYNPKDKILSGVFLGGVKFVKEIMKSAYEGELSYELSSRRTIENEIRREQILDFVSRCYNRDIEEIKAKEPGTLEARKFAVYLLRKTTGLKLQKIGEMFGISYKGVYWLYRSFNEQKNKSRKIKKYLKRFEKLSN